MQTNEILRIPFFNDHECDQLMDYADSVEKNLLQYEENFCPRITTKYFYKYNFFRDNPKYIDRFIETIKKELPQLNYPLAVQSWVNIYRKNDGIEPHNHSGYPFYSYAANIFLGGPTYPGITYFEPTSYEIVPNVRGEMHIFNCGHWHGVSPNQTEITRYSIGITFHSLEAITPHILKNCCYNTQDQGMVLLRDY